jgi:hypothetical protein
MFFLKRIFLKQLMGNIYFLCLKLKEAQNPEIKSKYHQRLLNWFGVSFQLGDEIQVQHLTHSM